MGLHWDGFVLVGRFGVFLGGEPFFFILLVLVDNVGFPGRIPRIVDDIEDRCFVYEFGSLALAAEVLLEEAEIVLVGDEAVLVLVDDLKGDANIGLLGCKFDEREGIIDGLYELGEVHDALVAAMIEFFTMQALDGYFSEVLFHAEVDQLVILDASIAIVVVPEDVFDEILHLRSILP